MQKIRWTKCENCGKSWKQERLNLVAHLLDRVMPGEIMPAGQCPDCEALCHFVPEGGRYYVIGIVHTSLTHYSVRANDDDEAMVIAKEKFEDGDEPIILGNESDQIDRIFVDSIGEANDQ